MEFKNETINSERDKQILKPSYRNFPMVPKVVFGEGSFDQLGDILMLKRESVDAPMIYLVDDVFKNSSLINRIPLLFEDRIIFQCAEQEPKTEQVDALVANIKENCKELPSGIIGIGGGTVMDLAKAVAIMLKNKGSSVKYQGWDLVNKPAIYHVGIPTISGTGAEVSRTTVLMGPTKKLGINSDYTVFDQVILDPELLQGVPKNKWFYTGMDCYIHCIESLNGTFLNAFSQSYGEKALDLCKDVFLGNLNDSEARAKLMMASWHGGMSIAYSQVGIAHALSYGLSFLLGIRHGLANCLVFQHLQEFYPEGVATFKKILNKHAIDLPKDICKGLSEDQFNIMINVSLKMTPLWENALGKDWKTRISPEKIRDIYSKI
ncbi:iron-containing alcohol dehydrogenase family protein [Eudoraea chungangensis]|uniref:iron-containing alcohol dehydrogenase family protein n=1 Tax=Eudoraea chungangensis TaxID=1481905 RepID=UPI0023EAA812|nr:iron-containing alcohol dehydrogenase family protein [Eudoraea chungangensis]